VRDLDAWSFLVTCRIRRKGIGVVGWPVSSLRSSSKNSRRLQPADPDQKSSSVKSKELREDLSLFLTSRGAREGAGGEVRSREV
jgi:hypothetical protein